MDMIGQFNIRRFNFKKNTLVRVECGPGYLSRYSDLIRVGRSGDRNPVGAKFSTKVQAGPKAHVASYTMGTGYFPGVKRPGRRIDHLPPHSAELKERVELYFCSPYRLYGLF